MTNAPIKVFTDPSSRRSLDQLIEPAIAAEFAQYSELYVTHDAARQIYAASVEAGADFHTAVARELPDDPKVKAGRFVHCPAPVQANASAAAHAGRVTEERKDKGPPQVGG
jgi:hypothetical protein